MNILLALSLLGVGAIFPFLFSIVGLFILSVINKGRKFLLPFVVLLTLYFFVLNFNKVIVNDLVWYSGHFRLNLGVGYFEIFDVFRLGVPAKSTEPVFHTLSYLLSNFSNGSYWVFCLLCTSLVYFLSSTFIYTYLSKLQSPVRVISIVLLYHLLMGIVFTQSYNLIRQYLAGVFFLIFIIKLAEGNSKKFILFGMLTCGAHNSAVVLVVLSLLSSVLINSRFQVKYKIFFGVLSSLTFSLMYFAAFWYLGKLHMLSLDDGSISRAMITLDFVLVFFSGLIFIRRVNFLSISEVKLYFLFLVIYSFCMFLMSSKYLGLRYYFYLDFFRWIPFYVIFLSIKDYKSFRPLLAFTCVVIFVVYFQLRFISTPFDYGRQFLESILTPLWMYF